MFYRVPERSSSSRAEQYVRMSTEHQQYSPENQLEVLRQYAASHTMEIVQEYSDHGRSGLNIAGREGLNKLMSDVKSKRTDFSALLVSHVSRWGRFQDVDESAYYEYVLKRAGTNKRDPLPSKELLEMSIRSRGVGAASRGHFTSAN